MLSGPSLPGRTLSGPCNDSKVVMLARKRQRAHRRPLQAARCCTWLYNVTGAAADAGRGRDSVQRRLFFGVKRARPNHVAVMLNVLLAPARTFDDLFGFTLRGACIASACCSRPAAPQRPPSMQQAHRPKPIVAAAGLIKALHARGASRHAQGQQRADQQSQSGEKLIHPPLSTQGSSAVHQQQLAHHLP